MPPRVAPASAHFLPLIIRFPWAISLHFCQASSLASTWSCWLLLLLANGFSPEKLEKASKQFLSGRPPEIFLSGTIVLLSNALKPAQQKPGMQVFFTYSKAMKMKASAFSDFELKLRVSRLDASFSMTLNVKARTGFLNKSTRLILVRPNQRGDLWAFAKV